MKYTLYYQPQTASDRKIAVATSDSLIKLLKIEKMTFNHAEGCYYILRTEEMNNRYRFYYGTGHLSRAGRADLMKFKDAVDGGKYFKSYDYRQRVRALLNGRK